MIEYDVRLIDLNRHLFEVQCHVPNPDQEQFLSMPSWIPGSYLLREFARHVTTIYAEDEDCLLYTSPSPRDGLLSRMPSSA